MSRLEQQIIDRFAEIEAALVDLQPSVIGIHPVKDLGADGLVQRKYKNRLQAAFLLLYHLQDDVKRFAKRRGLRNQVVDDFVANSLWVKLCVRAGNTHKHGLGGRSKNATLPHGLIYVVKTGEKENPTPDADAIVVGMTVADADYGTFASERILRGALEDWVRFLAAEFDLDLSVWLPRCIPKGTRPDIQIPPGENPTVPLGSTVTFELPKDLRDLAQGDAVKRRDET